MNWNETATQTSQATISFANVWNAALSETPTAIIFQLALSLGLGLLIGLQRERTNSSFGGIRTFPLISVFGTLSALASTAFGFWILPAGLLCLTLIGISERAFFLLERFKNNDFANGSDSTRPTVSLALSDAAPPTSTSDALLSEKRPKRDFGTTTLVCSLATFCVGAILANPAWTLVGLEAGAIVAILLQFKSRLHRIAETLGENDMNAIMQFAIVLFVVLPILPNENFGPFDAFNPFEAWLTVALIVGMSLAGYVVYKFYGKNAGVLFGGLIGGAVSSAATTTSYSKSVATGTTTAKVAAVVILLASATQTVRAMILEATVSSEFFYRCFPSSILFIAASTLPALWLWRSAKNEPAPETDEQQNPTQWKTALTFGVLYVVILLTIKAANAWFGEAGTFASVALSGLVEMNAVALSVARLATTDAETMQYGWKLMMIASIFSYFFKIGVVFVFGGRKFGIRTAPLFAIPCGVALATVLLF